MPNRGHRTISLHGRNYFVSRALIGERVQLKLLSERAVVYFCRTPVREFDLKTGASHHFDFGQFRRAALLAEPAGGSAPATP